MENLCFKSELITPKKKKKKSIQWFQLKKIHNRKKSKYTTIEWTLKKIVKPLALVGDHLSIA